MHYVQVDVLPSKNQALHYFNNCAIVMDCMWLNKDSLPIDIHICQEYMCSQHCMGLALNSADLTLAQTQIPQLRKHLNTINNAHHPVYSDPHYIVKIKLTICAL